MQLAPPTRRQARAHQNYSKVIAVWGTRASGKSTIALNIAATLASNAKVLLIDADTTESSLVVALGLTEHPAGLAPMLRFARLNRLSAEEFETQSMLLKAAKRKFTFIPGINPARWSEITPASMQALLEFAANHFDHIVIDMASELEQGLYSKQSPTERHEFNRWLIASAQKLLVLVNPDPVSLSRYLSVHSTIQELRHNKSTVHIINKHRSTAASKTELQKTFKTLTGVKLEGFLPQDLKAVDAALRNASTLNMLRGKPPLKKAIELLVREKKLAG